MKVLASVNTDVTAVMVGDIVLPGITFYANPSFTCKMKFVNSVFRRRSLHTASSSSIWDLAPSGYR